MKRATKGWSQAKNFAFCYEIIAYYDFSGNAKFAMETVN